MVGLRVFISHSTKGEKDKTFLNDLIQALRDDGHQILLDQDGIQPGDNWREELNLYIDSCDVALVLLSKSALESVFVAYEVSILTHRWRVESGFQLIPIRVEIDDKELENSLLNPSGIGDIQSLLREIPQDEIIKRVRDKLAEIAQR